MRYFLAGCALLTVLVLSVAGFRGQISRKPNIYIFPDMDWQPKLQPEHPNAFFADGRSSRLPVEGTVARSDWYEDVPENTGMLTGKTNFVESIPVPVTAELMARGRRQFTIYCSPCHGPLADGNGMTKRLGMAVVANLHDARIVKMAPGEIFNVITHGRNLMGAYGPVLTPQDRWAVISYLRALQVSQLGRAEDLPQAMRAALAK